MTPIPHTTIAPPLLFAAIIIAARRRDATWLIDMAAVLLYARWPSLFTLGLVVAQCGIRRVPTLAREVAMLMRVEEPAGWTLAVLLFVLPGLRAYTASQPPAATGATTLLPAPEPPPLAPRVWLRWANDDETAPHLGVVGPTRAGKTTLVLATLGQRKGELVILTPKSEETDPWAGFPAVRLDYTDSGADFSALADAVRQVHSEMLRRNAESTIGREQVLTLVIDEYTTLVSERPEVKPLVLQLWTLGASAKIRVVVIAPEVSVRAWGIEGRGDVRENLVFIRQGPDRAAAMFRIDQQARPLDPRRLDTRPVLQLAASAQISNRAWPRLSVWSGPSEGQIAPRARTQTADDELLAYLGTRMTREQARVWLAARGMGLDNNRWSAVAGRQRAPSA